MTKRIGLALGGGGARGICHIAFLKVMDEMGIRPNAIAGTSIGAIIGGFYAAGVSGLEMEQELANIGLRNLYKMAMDFSLFSQSAILKGKGVEEYLLEKIPFKTFEELIIPLKVVATDFWNRREVVFESGDLIGAIRASMAMPAVFEPVIRNNTVLIDGSAVNIYMSSRASRISGCWISTATRKSFPELTMRWRVFESPSKNFCEEHK